jgi:hypothetical protein
MNATAITIYMAMTCLMGLTAVVSLRVISLNAGKTSRRQRPNTASPPPMALSHLNHLYATSIASRHCDAFSQHRFKSGVSAVGDVCVLSPAGRLTYSIGKENQSC